VSEVIPEKQSDQATSDQKLALVFANTDGYPYNFRAPLLRAASGLGRLAG